MRPMNAGRVTAGLFVAVTLAGCAGTPAGSPQGPAAAGAQPAPAPGPAAAARAPLPHSAADARFMGDMIMHHAQAVLIAGWAPTHGAGEGVRRLAERIVVGQQDEMAIMQRWLRERGVTPADSGRAGSAQADSGHAGMDHSGKHHGGMDHSRMPGMLSPDELAQLDAARGTAFDRLFLTLMIKHHQGAVAMVEQLLGSHDAAQDETVFRIASDVSADQTAEIRRMQQMLSTLPSDGQAR